MVGKCPQRIVQVRANRAGDAAAKKLDIRREVILLDDLALSGRCGALVVWSVAVVEGAA